MIIDRRQLKKDQKDCANMLGISLKQYRNDINHMKVVNREKANKNKKYDNSLLNNLGIDESMLKKKKPI